MNNLSRENYQQRYLEDEGAAHHLSLALELVRDGYTILFNGDKEITGLDWKEKTADLNFYQAILALVANFDFETISDESLHQMIEIVTTFVLTYEHQGETSYHQLSSTDIEVSEAHRDTTPLEHILNVLRKVKLVNYLEKMATAQERQYFFTTVVMAVLGHDWGKKIKANGDELQYHAESSYLIFREVIALLEEEKRGQFDENLVLLAARYHHIFELKDKGMLTAEDVKHLVQGSEAHAFLTLISTADAESVEGYEMFAIGNLIEAITTLKVEELTVDDVNWLLSQVLVWLNTLMIKIQGTLEGWKKEYIAKKMALFQEWFREIPLDLVPGMSSILTT